MISFKFFQKAVTPPFFPEVRRTISAIELAFRSNLCEGFSMFQIFFTFLKLGLTSFGGPIAHLGFFHDEFVLKKKWIRENDYAELVALCQLLPGPASSQVGMAVGFYRGGLIGSILAWSAFTLPSALLLILFATTLTSISNIIGQDWLHGLKIAAVTVVAQAVWEMAKKFCFDFKTRLIALTSTITCLSIYNAWMQIVLIFIGVILGILFLNAPAASVQTTHVKIKNDKSGWIYLCLFFLFLVGLPLVAASNDSIYLKLADLFYRLGSLVFGGGHVVLPLIQSSMVESGLVTKEAFIAGYGAAQAIPGPLFSISAYLGFLCSEWKGAAISLVMIFLPSFFLILGFIPYWDKIRSYAKVKTSLAGVNAVVVGLLAAAFYNPVWTSAIFDFKDIVLAFVLFFLLTFKKVPSFMIVGLSALLTSILSFI